MAYTEMSTKTTGDIPGATDWNHIVNNFAAGVPDIMTTKGDLAVGSAANAVGRLGVGTNGQVLIADSAETLGLKWSSPISALARCIVAAAQNISTATSTIINYGTETYDPDNTITVGAAWKYTVPTGKAGYYLVSASLLLDANAGWEVGENANIALYKGGVLQSYLDASHVQAAGTYQIYLNGATMIYLEAAEYIDIRVYQNSDNTIATTNDGNASHIFIARLF